MNPATQRWFRRSRSASSFSCSVAALTEVGELACDAHFAYSFRKVPEIRRNTEKERMIIAGRRTIGCSDPFIWQYPRNFAISALYPPGEQQKEAARFLLAQTYECIHFRANISTRSLQERWSGGGEGSKGRERLGLSFSH